MWEERLTVDSIGHTIVVVVEDVTRSETEGWAAGVCIFPVVICVRNRQVACKSQLES